MSKFYNKKNFRQFLEINLFLYLMIFSFSHIFHSDLQLYKNKIADAYFIF